MALPVKQSYISPEQYLESQRTAEFPSEYMDGEMIAMSATGKAHGQIASALTAIVHTALQNKPCESSSGIAVEAPASYLIPDLVVYCDGGEFDSDYDYLQNPVIIFEILSSSTALYDRGRKWMRYQKIDSLMHYVLIAQDEAAIEVFTREAGGGWHYDAVSGLSTVIRLSHLDLEIPLVDLYQRVIFPKVPEEG
jgi:Uma2 family endonuclease